MKKINESHRRNTFEIYYDILSALNEKPKEINRTRLQQRIGMSYDKMSLHLDVLSQNNLIDQSLQITNKGQAFFGEIIKINNLSKYVVENYLGSIQNDV